ncbi:hypothetical protein CEXT_710741 [Caerostris extrusa]|uniref:Uncharacterized protein n=1 Tax=Caerostris extrusa TaxID=172846 RepID=A0AAV4NUT9_CAEEX|nr:hypothetical protein CEXT_710741 [Caerostris extrusa]
MYEDENEKVPELKNSTSLSSVIVSSLKSCGKEIRPIFDRDCRFRISLGGKYGKTRFLENLEIGLRPTGRGEGVQEELRIFLPPPPPRLGPRNEGGKLPPAEICRVPLESDYAENVGGMFSLIMSAKASGYGFMSASRSLKTTGEQKSDYFFFGAVAL